MDVDVVFLKLEYVCHLQQDHCPDVRSWRFLHIGFYLSDTAELLFNQLRQRVGRVRQKNTGSIHDPSGRVLFFLVSFAMLYACFSLLAEAFIQPVGHDEPDQRTVLFVSLPRHLSIAVKAFGVHRSTGPPIHRFTCDSRMPRHGGGDDLVCRADTNQRK